MLPGPGDFSELPWWSRLSLENLVETALKVPTCSISRPHLGKFHVEIFHHGIVRNVQGIFHCPGHVTEGHLTDVEKESNLGKREKKQWKQLDTNAQQLIYSNHLFFNGPYYVSARGFPKFPKMPRKLCNKKSDQNMVPIININVMIKWY